jgi:chitin disaccharide deacetylase
VTLTDTQPQARPTLAERLGFSRDDRLLIIHADDAGMCHSANVATTRALEYGLVTCSTIMVPCPWMSEVAAYCREHPEADFGVHLTLTSEWQHYRWGPVAPAEQVRSLLDAEGYLPRSWNEVADRAEPREVEIEFRAQIERACTFGVNPTHVDSHMGTAFIDRLYPIYTKVAREMGVMPMLLSAVSERTAQGAAVGTGVERFNQELVSQGFLFLDLLVLGPRGDTLEDRRNDCVRILTALEPGVSELILHLNLDDTEVQGIMGGWENRWIEYQIFTSPEMRSTIDSLDIKLIGYRELSRLAFKL